MLPIGEVSQDKKIYRDYAEYTKQFDATWTKTGLRS